MTPPARRIAASLAWMLSAAALACGDAADEFVELYDWETVIPRD